MTTDHLTPAQEAEAPLFFGDGGSGWGFGVGVVARRDDVSGRNGESYETEWTINPLLLEGSGYSEYKGYEDEVQALEDQARALEKMSEDIKEVKEATIQHYDRQVK